jgi:cytochrome c553
MRKAMHIPLTLIAILLGLASTLVQGAPLTQPVQEKERAVLFPSTRMINQGREVAKSVCASCHGMDGISDSEGTPQLAGQRAVYLYRVQQAYRNGTRTDEINEHNGFLDDEAVLAVSAYYSNLAAIPQAETPDANEQTDMAEEDPFLVIRDAMNKCVKCHGETGNGGGSGMPSLTAQHPDYFISSMMAYLDGSRSHRLMKKLAGNVDEATIRDMGVFYAVQEPVRSQTQGAGDVNVGRRISQECVSCHGDAGNANGASMPSLAGQDAKYFIKAMKQYKDGKRQHDGMFDAVEQLDEQEMIDLASYYAAQEPVKRNVRTPLKSTEWIARCARCHGIDGNSSDPRFPMLAGQDASYLKRTLQTYSEEGRGTSTMHAMADPLSAMDIDRIVAYFASQQPKAVVYIQLPCGDDQ